MEPEDLEPRKRKVEPRNLDIMGVKELEDYIAELEAEIARVRGVIAKKTTHKSAAESFFKR
ncbi:MAG: DUF1192 domain-containing protein [Alphaproteobacteria bacterium]